MEWGDIGANVVHSPGDSDTYHHEFTVQLSSTVEMFSLWVSAENTICVCVFVATNVFDATEIWRNCQFLLKELALMEQLSHSSPFVPVFCFSFIPI